MKRNEKVDIGFCHSGTVDTEFCLSVAQVIKKCPETAGNFFGVESLGLLTKGRNILVNTFLTRSDSEWLLILDSDEKISVETFNLLCDTADSQDRPVVSGLYFAALVDEDSFRPVPLIYKEDENGAISNWENYPKNQVVDIYAAGTGCLLVHRSIFEKMRDESPEDNKLWCWFEDGFIGNQQWLSEDLWFCHKLNEMGIKLVAHTGAVVQHNKSILIDESHYDSWLNSITPDTTIKTLD